MSKFSARALGGGGAVGEKFHAVEHPYYLKKMPMNPWFGATHDGMSQGYNKGFTPKPMHWLYRFRHNHLPTGVGAGAYAKNRDGKFVHWLEVSTIEKMRLQIVSEEAIPMSSLTIFVILFTFYHSYRQITYNPDYTWKTLVLWPMKPFVNELRGSAVMTLDQPVFKYFQRVPEWYAYDPYREMIKNGVLANDPYIEFVKSQRPKEAMDKLTRSDRLMDTNFLDKVHYVTPKKFTDFGLPKADNVHGDLYKDRIHRGNEHIKPKGGH